LVGSGTNAPLYTASFSAARPKAQEDLQNHEDRLAEALELDRNARVLEFRDPSSSPSKPPTIGRTKGSELDSRTVWDGTEWVMGGADLSKSLSIHFQLILCSLSRVNLYFGLNRKQKRQSPKKSELFQWLHSSQLLSHALLCSGISIDI
jgi:hypothetical protein